MRRARRRCGHSAGVGSKNIPSRETDARYLDRRNSHFGDLGRANAGRQQAMVGVPSLPGTMPLSVSAQQNCMRAVPQASECGSPPGAPDAWCWPRRAVAAQARRLRCATVCSTAGAQARPQPCVSRQACRPDSRRGGEADRSFGRRCSRSQTPHSHSQIERQVVSCAMDQQHRDLILHKPGAPLPMITAAGSTRCTLS